MRKELQELEARLKEQHGEIYVLTVGEDKESLLYGFFRKPTFNEFRMIYPLMQKGDDLMTDKRFLEMTFLGGDKEISDVENNLEIFLSVKSVLSEILELKEANLKKK